MEYTVPYKKQRPSENNSMSLWILKEQYLLLQIKLENLKPCAKLHQNLRISHQKNTDKALFKSKLKPKTIIFLHCDNIYDG